MHPELTRLEALDDLDRLLAATEERPLLLFKHSYTCGVSAEALDELVAHLNDRPAEAKYALVTVQTHREISNAVAKRLGVRHETPQALVIRKGRVVWSASHFRVTASAMGEALSTVAQTRAMAPDAGMAGTIRGSARATARRPTPTTTPTGN